MNLNTVHKITMGTAMLGGLVYALWSGQRFFAEGGAGHAVAAGVALLATLGLGVYLRRFIARTAQDKRGVGATPEKAAPET